MISQLRPLRLLLLLALFLLSATGASHAFQASGENTDEGFTLFPNAPDPVPEDPSEKKEKLRKPKNNFTVDMGVGYSKIQGGMQEGAWYPVWIEISAKVGDAEGVVIITQMENPMTVEKKFFVKEGSTKRYQTYYKLYKGDDTPIRDNIEALVVSKTLPDKIIPLNYRVAEERDQCVLVFTEEVGSFHFLVRRTDLNGEISANSLPERTITYGISEAGRGKAVDLLPQSATALEGLDSIIINGPQVSDINQRQWEVIQGWVASGGKLLLAGGRHQPFIAQSNLAQAFGMEIGDTESATLTLPVPGKAEEEEKSLQVQTTFPKTPRGQWDAIRLGDRNEPWIVSKRVGSGWFNYCAFALDEKPLALLANKVNSAALWATLLERDLSPTNLDNLANTSGKTFEKGLQKTFVIHLAGLKWVFVYLLLYNLIAIPLNWWICKRYKRSDWSWFILLAMAAGFAWFGYYSGMKRQRHTFQVNELTLVRKAEGVNTARATTFDVVYSPRKYRKGMSTNALVFPVPLNTLQAPNRRNRNSYQRASFLPITLSFGGQTDIKNLNILSFASKTYRTDFTLEGAGNITPIQPLRAPTPSLPLRGKLLNETPWTFQKIWIGNGEDLWVHASP